MDLLGEEEREGEPTRRHRIGRILGGVGLAVLFGSGVALAFVPGTPLLPLVALLAAGTGLLVVAYLAVR